MKKFHKPLFFLALFFCLFAANAQDTIYQIDIDKEIGSTTWRYLRTGLHQARENGAKAVVLRLNTYGGTVVHADSMRTAILNCPLPVYAFVDNNAASAGALIAIACDSIYMRSSASMGAATVVNETGAAMPDKYQSYMRATMRATAEAHGKDSTGNWRRNPLIAEAMVDERIVVPHLCDSGKVLTLTASEAIAQRYCEGTVESVDELIAQQLHRNRYTLQQFEPSLFDEIAGFLTNPALQAILVTLIFGGIFMELKTPGVGLPAAVACTAAVLYFAPLYLDGLAANWEILIFVVGVILLIFEIFVIPGFGIAGISGFTLIFAALVLALVGNVNFDFEFVPGREIGRGLITVSAGFIIYFVLLLLFFKKLTSKGPIGRLALNSAQDKDEGYIGVPPELQQYIGQTGEAATILRPSGKVVIDGTQFDAVALHGYIEQGATVRVVKYENAQLYVVEVK
ncbi:nodulation protein NfeD [Barnesiella sp. ET7]|uniref:NfeD family protein n=1 Tax=Barnesiella sp. ET7 TaxID=2972460 RepID=UPI0021AD32C8|nr:NfeD family protein [Barnesiella sp. ET7]MCR8910654.1 nodulation protein NfeD [Barnesiella sp. ET7]